MAQATGSDAATAAQAGQLAAELLGALGVDEGAARLATRLAALAGCERVWIAVHEADGLRFAGGSAHDDKGLPPDLRPLLLGAMQEALDQGVPLACPAPEAGGATDAILLEHRLLQAHLQAAVACVPLGLHGVPVAAVCAERPAGQPFDADELQRLAAWLAPATPALHWMQAAQLPWRRRARQALAQAWQRLRAPGQRGRRRLLLAGALVLAFATTVPLSDTVSGRARIEGAEQRQISAPTDGFVKTVHVRPGDRVRAGDPLVDLLDADQRLEQERWSQQLAQHENAYAAAMANRDRVAAATSLARVSEAQAQLALIAAQIARGRLVAPFDGVVIQGDLAQSIGAPVRQGDLLLTLADNRRQRVIVDVDEVDIARVQPGQAGRLSLSAWLWAREPLRVERIAPLARAVEGRNVFEVEARLLDARPELRPGLLGRASIDAGRAPLLWAWTQHALLRLRVALWAWWG
ncbi:HlyD family efflux transporter periplasmic adaptor subunit [uncultured Pseudacidovorax sp.]|uniref:efflux RND transporter periplasmic adaptor subunit n=1 Tax=uncultured Pseudacidovorax sp. TaxID=679313 RepID=UPI0025D6CFB2|nr:HlyD family efflux transporter periplasmic adaptor subunit [uncultured Pseudacidovorax sp.]